jgi:hypothetical protein
LLNSCLGLFTAAYLRKRLFFRSYETNLPSSLATIHSSALGYSPRLPVSVYGTGCVKLKLRGFSWKPTWVDYPAFPKDCRYYHVSAQSAHLTTHLNAYAFQRTIPSVRTTYVSPSPHRTLHKYGNIDPFAIGIPSRVILRTRLTRN